MARFWQYAHLTDGFRGMSYFDKVPQTSTLYIGGVGAFHQEPDPLSAASITHVVSVIDFDVGENIKSRECKHLYIQADDRADENLLRHFNKSNDFIDDALSENGAVFVHCAMGVSRSATLVTAYLMHKYGLSARDALSRLREGRSQCRPNEGFLRQLEVYDKMLRAKDQAIASDIYEKWLKSQTMVGHTDSKL